MDNITGFQWDAHNAGKNWEKHRVTPEESEQVFLNRPLMTSAPESRQDGEPRHYALGETDEGRRLFIVFTVRGDLIRVISARDMSRKERMIYEDRKED